LLLLSGLLATALLAGLLARVLVLLTRILVLLARVLVLVRHGDLPGLNVTVDNLETRGWFQGNFGSDGIVAWRWHVATMAAGTPGLKMTYVQALKPHPALLPHPVPTVRK
jgi:hypothetical protein